MNDEKGYVNAPVSAQDEVHGPNPHYKNDESKTVPIAVSHLRRALADAENRLQQIAEEICEHEHKRDHYARSLGETQNKLDFLNRERSLRAAHVRALDALLP